MKEIERKFLVRDLSFKVGVEGVLYRQGYISQTKESVVRVRIAGDEGYLTIKTKTIGITRNEFEYKIPLEDAKQLLDSVCEKPLIEKVRYMVSDQGNTWEVDEFLGDNEGLIIAEIELENEHQEIAKPSWIGDEVSHDPRYYNSNLVKNPFKYWS